MKTLITLFAFAVVFTSCKKDRVCSCKYQDGSVASETTYKNVTKKEAKNLCVSSSASINCTVN